MLNDYPDIMTISQVAEALRIGKNSAYSLVKKHEIGSKRIGRKYIVPKSCVIEYIQSAKISVVYT